MRTLGRGIIATTVIIGFWWMVGNAPWILVPSLIVLAIALSFGSLRLALSSPVVVRSGGRGGG